MHRLLLRALICVVASVALYLGYIMVQIYHQSHIDEARKADVIVVLGAAEYRGRPSPVLRARVEHAKDLYDRQIATRILTTGGAGGDPVFTEGEVARDYLARSGVPSEAIIVEKEGGSTFHSIVTAAEIMQRMGLKSCVVVSDGYHIYRAKKMLESKGVHVYGSPRPGETTGFFREVWLYFRQSVGYALWRIGITI